MRVLYLTGGDVFGSGQALTVLLKQLSEKIEPMVIYSYEGGLKESLQTLKIPCRKVNMSYNWYPWKPWGFHEYFQIIKNRIIWSLSIFKLLIIALRFKPDIIHTNSGVFDIGLIVAEWLGIKHVWHLREYHDLDNKAEIVWSKAWYMRRLNARLNYNIAITNGIKSYFHPQKCKVIYDGVESKYFSEPKIDKQKYFLFVGNFSAHKGVEMIVDAFISIADRCQDYEIWFAGDGSRLDFVYRINDKINKSSCNNRIKMLGFTNQVNQLMQQATATIVASDFEGFGLVTAEAMFNQCLVIGKDIAGTKEQFDNGLHLTGHEIGLRYITVEDLEKILVEVADNGIAHYEQMIKDAQTTVNELYTPVKSAQSVFTLYKELLNNEI